MDKALEVLLILFNSSEILYNANSLLSIIINFLGFNLKICLLNSLPIEPPQPEMTTFLFETFFSSKVSFGFTGLFPKDLLHLMVINHRFLIFLSQYHWDLAQFELVIVIFENTQELYFFYL